MDSTVAPYPARCNWDVSEGPSSVPAATAWFKMAPRRASSSGSTNFTAASCSPKRSEEHTSELQSLMRISYAVFCLKKKKKHNTIQETATDTHTTNKKNTRSLYTQHINT